VWGLDTQVPAFDNTSTTVGAGGAINFVAGQPLSSTDFSANFGGLTATDVNYSWNVGANAAMLPTPTVAWPAALTTAGITAAFFEFLDDTGNGDTINSITPTLKLTTAATTEANLARWADVADINATFAIPVWVRVTNPTTGQFKDVPHVVNVKAGWLAVEDETDSYLGVLTTAPSTYNEDLSAILFTSQTVTKVNDGAALLATGITLTPNFATANVTGPVHSMTQPTTSDPVTFSWDGGGMRIVKDSVVAGDLVSATVPAATDTVAWASLMTSLGLAVDATDPADVKIKTTSPTAWLANGAATNGSVLTAGASIDIEIPVTITYEGVEKKAWKMITITNAGT